MNSLDAIFWFCAIALAYVYLGYPGLMWIAGRFAARRPATASGCPDVSIIIPAHNEAEVLEEKLRNVLEIKYPADHIEVIVASDGSTDGTVEIARRFESDGIRTLDLPRGGKAATLNAAVSEATGDVLCLCDANVMFRPDSLERLVNRLSMPEVGAVTADVRLASHESDFGAGETMFYRFERQIQLGETRVGSVIGVDGGMYVLRRKLFRPIPADTVLDDFTITIGVIRQGFCVAYEPEAIATENGTPTSAAEFHRRMRVAAGAVQSLRRRVWPPVSRPVECWQYLSHKLLRWMGPYLILSLLLINIGIFQTHLIYVVTLSLQALAIVFAFLSIVSQRFRRTAIGGIPYYFALSNLATAIGHLQGLCGRQTAMWNRTERSTRINESMPFDKASIVGGRS